MDEPSRCQQCDVPLSGQEVGGLCANCLLKLALEPPAESAAMADGAATSPFGNCGDHPDRTALPGEQPGDTFGRFKLLQLIGEGGFGTVWMAEQNEPVQRRVALKIIRMGMDTREFVARFEQERQALAMMDHPNIAKVFDAGATDSGRPFFVMEMVRGIPITKFCDEQKLPLAARLELFIEVCRAIQHAHQKGIIHRDIKPSNVMVALDGDKPVPKVIDFGIAKATQGKLTDETVFTRFEQFIGTPVYMSPEQVGMVSDIDTRSDIYALGVLLYELLTGKPPFDAKSLVAAGHEEMRRIIREVEPPRPSSRLGTLSADERTTLANARQIEPAGLSRMVDEDLDWIVMKAIEKERTRRYETVNGLALDIQRFLSDEPVSATPPSANYKFRKFARRNKTSLRVGAGIAVVLVAATIVSSWQAVRATNAEKLSNVRLAEVAAERDRKDRALRSEEEISAFLSNVFQSPDPSQNPRDITVAESLDRAAKKLEADLASQPGHRARFQSSLGRTYHALGLYPEAIRLREKVRDYYRANAGPEHPVTIDTMRDVAISYGEAGRREEALKLEEEVLTLSRKINGPQHPSTLDAINNLALSYSVSERREEALRMFEELLPLRLKVNGPEHLDTLKAMHNLATSWHYVDRRDEALKMREEVLTLRRKALAPEHPDTLMAMGNLARSYRDAGRLDEALSLREELLPLCRKVWGPEHPNTLTGMHNFASSYSDVGRKEDAIKLGEEMLALSRKVNGPEHPNTFNAMYNLAGYYSNAGRRDAALTLREELLPLIHKVLGPKHPHTMEVVQDLAQSYDDAGRKAEAETLRKELADRGIPAPSAPAPTPPPETKITVQKKPELPDMAVSATLVAPDSEWKWLHPTEGKDPAETVAGFHTSFFLPGFDDSSWQSGQDSDEPDGGFGYGLSFTGVNIGKPDDVKHRKTAWFRHRFTTDTTHGNIELRCRRDDGIIVYLDGKEVIRDNVAPGADSWLLPSAEAMERANDSVVHRHVIPGPLAPGSHILAISVHNTAQPSTDLRLGGVTLVEVKPAAAEK